MGSSLGPVLANIIMTELENVIVRNLLADGTVAFCARYVDDTLDRECSESSYETELVS